MRTSDIFFLAFKALRTRKIRTTLLILSVTVGIAAIIALTSQTEGVGRGITSALQRLGPDTIIVNVMGRRMTDSDIAVIHMLDGVRDVIPIIRETGTINLGGSLLNVVVYGIDSYKLGEVLGDVNLIDGSPYQDVAIPLAIIGNQIAFLNTTDQPSILPGQVVTISTRGGPLSSAATTIAVIVTGILNRYGAMGLISPDTSIFIPLQAAQQIFNRRWYDLLIVKANDVNSVDIVIENLRNVYGGSASILSTTQMAQTMQSVIAQTTLLLGGIAAISLIAAALGILNMMLVTITERTREIGTMKALGFKNRHILAQIIIEGLLIGVFGGVSGVAIGISISYILPGIVTMGMTRSTAPPTARTANPTSFTPTLSYEPYINPAIVLVSLVLAVAVSVISSLYPAWRAAKMDPVKALRYE